MAMLFKANFVPFEIAISASKTSKPSPNIWTAPCLLDYSGKVSMTGKLDEILSDLCAKHDPGKKWVSLSFFPVADGTTRPPQALLAGALFLAMKGRGSGYALKR